LDNYGGRKEQIFQLVAARTLIVLVRLAFVNVPWCLFGYHYVEASRDPFSIKCFLMGSCAVCWVWKCQRQKMVFNLHTCSLVLSAFFPSNKMVRAPPMYSEN
jgi:hypothetical protein